jgi:hypothetical protein
MVEPFGQGGVEVSDRAFAIDREETGRRMVEIVDRVLQLLEDVLLLLALAGDLGDRPHRHARVASLLAEGTDPQPEPAARLPAVRDPHLFVLTLALASRLEQAVNRFRHLRIADEDPLDRTHLLAFARRGELQVRAVGIDDPARTIGNQDRIK